MTDEKDDNKLSRRGFIGILGAAGAAAFIPLHWEIDPKVEAALEEQIACSDTGAPEVVPEEWEEPEEIEAPVVKSATVSKGKPGPVLELYKYLEHPNRGWQKGGKVLVGIFPLLSYNMDISRDITEDMVFGDGYRTTIPGLMESTVECTFLNNPYPAEAAHVLNNKLFAKVKVDKDIAFEFDCYGTSCEHEQYSAGSPVTSRLELRLVGEMRRIYTGYDTYGPER